MKPKLQLALDTVSLQNARQYARELIDYWDILEIGTPLLLNEGFNCVKEFRKTFQYANILVDTKIIDNGSLISSLACKAGANIITVVSAASKKSITDCISAAHANNCQVLLDHISENWEASDFIKKSNLEVDLIGLHFPKDIQTANSIRNEKLERIIEQIDKPIFLAGGMNPQKIHQLKGLPISVFVIGGYLLNAENKLKNAINLKSELQYFTGESE